MIHTPVCDLLGIRHPVVLGGMAGKRWAGRERELRARQPEVAAALDRAGQEGNEEEASLLMGQDGGLIRDLSPAGEVVERTVAQGEALIRDRLPALVRPA